MGLRWLNRAGNTKQVKVRSLKAQEFPSQLGGLGSVLSPVPLLSHALRCLMERPSCTE